MNTKTINLHEALSELKIIDKKILRKIEELDIVETKLNKDTRVTGIDEQEFKDTQKALWESINDTIKYSDALKASVQQSNAVTKVYIGSVEYTVAEAISMKNNGLEKKMLLLDKLSRVYKLSKQKAEKTNEYLTGRADEYLSSMGVIKDAKNPSAEEKAMRDNYISTNTMVLVSPINVTKEIELLSEDIDKFTVEVDSKLSTSNALTEITVEW